MFWLENPKILFSDDFDFQIPSGFVDRLNFFFRYSLILSIILAIIFQDLNFLLLAIIIGLITIMFYYNRKEHYNNDDEITIIDNKVCRNSTFHNPFMNPSLLDIKEHQIEACNHEKVDMNKKFYEGVYRSANDLYDKEASLRQFYTVPSTTIPNNQGEFANWLYNQGPSCKEGNYDRCTKNINLHRTDLDKVRSGS